MQEELQQEEFQTGKIYCANCFHCKLLPAGENTILHIRCAAGKWKKKLGQEKVYKYCTITRRYLDQCETYEDMGDTPEFIKELRKAISEETAFSDK
jgi:hypothetical protein